MNLEQTLNKMHKLSKSNDEFMAKVNPMRIKIQKGIIDYKLEDFDKLVDKIIENKPENIKEELSPEDQAFDQELDEACNYIDSLEVIYEEDTSFTDEELTDDDVLTYLEETDITDPTLNDIPLDENLKEFKDKLKDRVKDRMDFRKQAYLRDIGDGMYERCDNADEAEYIYSKGKLFDMNQHFIKNIDGKIVRHKFGTHISKLIDRNENSEEIKKKEKKEGIIRAMDDLNPIAAFRRSTGKYDDDVNRILKRNNN